MSPFLLAALAVALVAAFTDQRAGRIPDRLTLPTILGAPVAHFVHAFATHAGTDTALAEAGGSLVGGVACAVIPLALYRQDALAFGDVKLFVALGAVLKPQIGFEAQSYAFVAAALLAPARLAYEGKLLVTLKNSVLLLVNPLMPKDKRRPVDPSMMSWFRLGPAVFAGTCIACLLHWRGP